MRLIRGEDGKLFQAGSVDLQPIPLKKQLTMKGVSTRRKALTTPAEKKLCFALQAVVWFMGGCVRYQREKTVHLADILSRSIDFFFPQGKLGIEADGRSHADAIQGAKDVWTDELMLKHSGILVARFRNEAILGEIHSVARAIAVHLRDRHGWPMAIRNRFDELIQAASSPESWRALTTGFLTDRRRR